MNRLHVYEYENNTNYINDSICNDPKSINSIQILFECYKLFAQRKIYLSILELGLVVGIMSANLIVIIFILRKKQPKTIFDKILIGHSIVDGLTGLLDVPYFHIYSLFEFWPMGETMCFLWNSYDTNMNTITNLHMLYMTWVRIRCILAPKSYLNETIIKHPITVMILIWIIGFTIWVPINSTIIGNLESNNFQCAPPLNPSYLIIVLQLFFWFTPLFLILLLTLFVMYLIREKNKKKGLIKTVSSANVTEGGVSTSSEFKIFKAIKNPRYFLSKMFKLNSQTKLTIIIATYLLQWCPSCIIALIDPVCLCIPDNVTAGIYWLTYG